MNKKKLLTIFLFGIIFWLIGSYIGSQYATRTHFKKLPPASKFFSQIVENPSFTSKDGVVISSWFLPNAKSKKAVILLNGIGGNRTAMVSRANIYLQENYNVLMPDLRGTGESGGEAITFGWEERWDLLAAVDFLKNKGMDTIAVHGISLGAATIVYSFQENQDYAYVVLESCYDNIDNALHNRIEKYHIPIFVFAAMRKFTEWEVGVASEKLSPESFMNLCKYPTLILAGDSEVRVRKEETQKLFEKCISPTKKLHFFKNAKHEDFLGNYKLEFEEILTDWIERVSKVQE